MSGGVPAGEGLKACPFCNSAAAVFWCDGFPQVRCDECGAVTGMFTTGDERDAITAWNRRATPTPPIEGRDADVEQLKQALEDVCNPLAYLKRMAEAEGAKLGGMAYSIANDIATIQGIARAALQALGERG